MKIFYGWRIAMAAGALQFLQSLLLHQAFGAYLPVLVEEKGWSRTSLSGAAAMGSTEAALLGPVLGWMIDRFGAQATIRLGVVTFGIGFILLGQTDTLFSFYAAFILISLGSAMCSHIPVSVAIIQWFEKHRARALSSVQFGGAIGGTLVFLVAAAIQTFGWRATAMGSGVLAIVIGWPLASIMRSRPEDHGETVDGLPPAPRNTDAPARPLPRAFTVREAMRTSAFWLVSLGHGLALLVVSALAVHAISHLKEGLGYSLAEASLVIALVTGGQLIGVMLGWVIGDKFEKRIIAAVCMLVHAVGLLMLTYATSPILLALSALGHGTSWGLRGSLMHAIRADYFGRRSIGMIIGLSSLITVVGQVTGPILAGAFADWAGDYRMGFTVIATIAGLGSILFFLAKPPVQKSPA